MPWTWAADNAEDPTTGDWEWTGGGEPDTSEPSYSGSTQGETGTGGAPVDAGSGGASGADTTNPDDPENFVFEDWMQEQMAQFPGEYDDFLNLLKEYNQEFFDTGDTIGDIADTITDVGDSATAAAGNIGVAAGQIGESAVSVGQQAAAVSGDAGLVRTTGDESFGLAQEFQDIAGGTDPRFAEYQEAQFALQERGAERQRASTSSYFARRGLGTSSAGLDASLSVERDLGLAQEGLAGELGLQQLQRQDTARASALGAFGQAGGLYGAAGGLEATAGNLYGTQGGLYAAQAGAFSQQVGAYGTAAGIYGGAVDAYGSSLNAYSAGLDNAQIPMEILLALQQLQVSGGINT